MKFSALCFSPSASFSSASSSGRSPIGFFQDSSEAADTRPRKFKFLTISVAKSSVKDGVLNICAVLLIKSRILSELSDKPFVPLSGSLERPVSTFALAKSVK